MVKIERFYKMFSIYCKNIIDLITFEINIPFAKIFFLCFLSENSAFE